MRRFVIGEVATFAHPIGQGNRVLLATRQPYTVALPTCCHRESGHLVLLSSGANLIFPSSQGSDDASLHQDVTTGVLRYRRDIGGTSTLGLLFTGRQGETYRNRLYGVDGNLRPTPSDQIRFQLLGSMTNYPFATATEYDQPTQVFHGFGADLTYVHSSRNWAWWTYFDHRDPGFRADAGFVPMVDYKEYGLGGQRNWWGDPGDFLNSVTVGAEAERTGAGSPGGR